MPLNLAGNVWHVCTSRSGLSDFGMPVGLQIMAPALEDARLYRVGAAFEKARGPIAE
ncbi:MAG: hypothetical protein U1U88_000377 [Lawsonella clevelandensis]